MFESFEVVLGVYGFNGDKLGGEPFFPLGLGDVTVTESVFYNVNVFEIGFHIFTGMNGLLIEQTVVEVAQCLKHVATYVYVVVDALSLEVVHAGGCSGYDKLCAAVEILEGCGCKLCILVIA